MKGCPEAWTRVPGAWLATQIVAVADARKTGRGSWGNGRAVGCSRQIRHALIAAAISSSGSGPGGSLRAADTIWAFDGRNQREIKHSGRILRGRGKSQRRAGTIGG